MKLLVPLVVFLSVFAICYAHPIDDKNLFQQILPNKYLVIVSEYSLKTGTLPKQFPAAEEIEVNGETLLACCYRDNKPENAENESGQLIHIAIFKKEKDGYFRLLNQPNPIKYTDSTDKLLQPWVESAPINQKTQAIVVIFSYSLTTFYCVFDFENNRLRFLDTKRATGFEMKDLNNDGENELIFKTHSFANVFEPPVIYQIVNGTLVDSGSHFPNFYKNVIAEYDQMLQSSALSGAVGLIKMMKLEVYGIIDDPNKKIYGEQLKSEMKNEILKIKSDPDWKIVDLKQPAHKPEDRKAFNLNMAVNGLERDLYRVNKIIGAN